MCSPWLTRAPGGDVDGSDNVMVAFKAHKAGAGAAFQLLRVTPGDKAAPPEEAPAGGGHLKKASIPTGANVLMQGYGGHGCGPLVSAAFSADGGTLVTATDGAILQWRLLPAEAAPAHTD